MGESRTLEDGIGKVELMTYMGDDLMVVNAARVSYDKESEWEEQIYFPNSNEERKFLKDEDVRLIHYLATHGHWTPFSQPQIQFRIKMPIFIAREWYRHTIGLTRNEVSRRYVNSDPEFFIPSELRNKPEPGKSKQGSQGTNTQSQMYIELMKQEAKHSLTLYKKMIIDGVAPEQARICLPQSMYTEFIETGSLAAYSRIAKLRLQPDAMWETKRYAIEVSSLIEPLFPISWSELMAN